MCVGYTATEGITIPLEKIAAWHVATAAEARNNVPLEIDGQAKVFTISLGADGADGHLYTQPVDPRRWVRWLSKVTASSPDHTKE